MKTPELITLRALQGLSILLCTIVIIAVGFAALQVVSGNVYSTASFEF
jgi:hypothetical protein